MAVIIFSIAKALNTEMDNGGGMYSDENGVSWINFLGVAKVSTEC